MLGGLTSQNIVMSQHCKDYCMSLNTQLRSLRHRFPIAVTSLAPWAGLVAKSGLIQRCFCVGSGFCRAWNWQMPCKLPASLCCLCVMILQTSTFSASGDSRPTFYWIRDQLWSDLAKPMMSCQLSDVYSKAGASSKKLCKEQSIPFSWFDCGREAAYFKHLVLQWSPECCKADQGSHGLFFGPSLLPCGSLRIAHLLSSFLQHQVLLQMVLELSWLIPLKTVPTWLQVSDMLPIQTATVSSGSGHVCWSSRAWIQTLEVSMEKFLFVSALDLVPISQHCAEYEPGSCWRQYLMQHHVTTLDFLSSAFKTQSKYFTHLPMVIQEHKRGRHFLKSSRLIPCSLWQPCHSNPCINPRFGSN